MADAPMTVVETARFLKDTKPLMSDSEREELIAFVGANPAAGEIIRKPAVFGRFGGRCMGEGSAAGRVIYYFHDEHVPLFLLAAYAKNEKANLSMAERDAMKRLIPVLLAGYPATNRRGR